MIAAVDIGGTKTLVAVFNEDGEIVQQEKFPTDVDYEKFKTDLANCVAKLSTSEFLRIAVGVPGRIDRKNGIAISCGNLGWKNVSVQADVENIFSCPGFIENDAKLAGLSEANLLKDRYGKVLYLTISTGIGIALIINGEIDVDLGDSGGKAILLEHKGELVPWESYASGKAIVSRYGKRASEIEDEATWKLIVEDLLGGVLDLIALTVPDVVVLGGGVGAHFDKFGHIMNEQMKRYETPMLPVPPIIGAQRAEEAVIYGCYDYAKQHVA